MKSESMPSETRVKLHICNIEDVAASSGEVKNIWMCLNYDQKPTVRHVIEHIKKHYVNKETSVKKSELANVQVKLYLDGYWLPPYENSRLLRENDCIKVDIEPVEENNALTLSQEKSTQGKTTTSAANTTHTKQVTTHVYTQQEEAVDSKEQHQQPYYNHYNFYKDSKPSTTATNYWNTAYTEPSWQPVQSEANYDDVSKKSEIETQSEINKQQKTWPNYYKKFAVGSLLQMLNERSNEIVAGEVAATTELSKNAMSTGKKKNKKDKNSASQQQQMQPPLLNDDNNASEEQVIDNYYEYVQQSKNSSTSTTNNVMNAKERQLQERAITYAQKQQAKQSGAKSQMTNGELDKIAANVNATSKQKWKNNAAKKPTQTGPKHIIFSSNSSDSEESDSDQKSASNEQTVANTTKCTNNNGNTNNNKKGKKNKSDFYEPSKEEQLNAISYNRSFVIQNPKTLNEFKKVFNETKLNAPRAEKFVASTLTNSEQDQTENTSIDSEDKSPKSSSKNSKRAKKGKSPSPPRSPKKQQTSFDFTSLDALKEAPKLNDRLAFKILEISSNFTPEISDYKIGQVIEFNAETSECTLRLESTEYNAVLKRANKFTVVLDETETEEVVENVKESHIEDETENLLKVDWRNLMDVRVFGTNMEKHQKEKHISNNHAMIQQNA